MVVWSAWDNWAAINWEALQGQSLDWILLWDETKEWEGDWCSTRFLKKWALVCVPILKYCTDFVQLKVPAITNANETFSIWCTICPGHPYGFIKAAARTSDLGSPFIHNLLEDGHRLTIKATKTWKKPKHRNHSNCSIPQTWTTQFVLETSFYGGLLIHVNDPSI